MPHRGQTLVITPTLNEAKTIGVLLPRIAEELPGTDILVVDDGSPDGTADLARAVAQSLPNRVEVVSRSGSRGDRVVQFPALSPGHHGGESLRRHRLRQPGGCLQHSRPRQPTDR